MAILYFQLFVIITILAAGALSRSALLPVCLAWTAFTFLAVFASPLLQLATIWITYSALAGTPKTAPVATAAKHGRGEANRPIQNDAVGKPLAKVADLQATPATEPPAGQAKGGILDELNGFVRSAQAVQQATSELSLAIYAERRIIDNTLGSARRTLEIEAQFAGDPARAEHYRKTYADLLARMKTDGPEANEIGRRQWVKPKFARPPAHAKPEVTANIDQGTPTQFPDRYAAISSPTHIHPAAPPTLVLAGLADHLLPPAIAFDFRDRAQASGIPVRLIAFPYGEHSFDQVSGSIGNQLVRGAVVQFLAGQKMVPGSATH